MLVTAKAHFDDDIKRSKEIFTHGTSLPAGLLRDDILRSSLMFAIGALDAYFCDAYADLIARTLSAKDIEPTIPIPHRLGNLKIPIVAVIRPVANGWRWRIAARELIEKQNVLSTDAIKTLLNQFFRDRHKLLTSDTIPFFICQPNACQRMFGISKEKYRALSRSQKDSANKKAVEHLEKHFEKIFQRRHDCIHNCDRPKVAPQPINEKLVKKIMADVEFLVNCCNDRLKSEFPHYLTELGFAAKTQNRVMQ